MTLAKKVALYVKAKDAYYNLGKSIMTDAEFDELENEIKRLDPKNDCLKGTGILGKKTNFDLPVPLPSLSKVKADSGKVGSAVKKLEAYSTHVCIMPKFDGSSVIAIYKAGKLVKVATRGNGIVGKDISFLAPHTKLPKKLKIAANLEIRMEAIMPKKVFEKKYASKYDSARAVSAGCLNRQSASRELSDLEFIALRTLRVDGYPIPFYEGMALLNKLGFTVSPVILSPIKSLNAESALPKALDTWVGSGEYELDGLVVHANSSELPKDDNKPKFAFAYKSDEVGDAPTTTILDVEWNVSSFGQLVPKAILKPVKFGSVTVKQASLHNAQWMKDRGIGVGAVVKIIRSGEIIPKIISVVTPAKFKLPSCKVYGNYEWDGPNLKLTEASEDMLVKRFERFISHAGMEHLGPAVAKSLVAHGCPSPALTLKLITAEKWERLGFSSAMSKKYAEAVVKARKAPLETLMSASGCFDRGVGSTRIKSLLDANPETFELLTTGTNSVNSLIKSLAEETKGCGTAFSVLLSNGLPEWRKFIKAGGLVFEKPKKKLKKLGGKFQGLGFTFTGYRNKEQESYLVDNGGEIVPFGAKTNVLLYLKEGKASSKIEQARKKGIKVLTFKDLF